MFKIFVCIVLIVTACGINALHFKDCGKLIFRKKKLDIR